LNDYILLFLSHPFLIYSFYGHLRYLILNASQNQNKIIASYKITKSVRF
jgi:hypothetical protein